MAAAPYGSSLILPISYAYISMMGSQGLTNVSAGCQSMPTWVLSRARCLAGRGRQMGSGIDSLIRQVAPLVDSDQPGSLLAAAATRAGFQAGHPERQLHGQAPGEALPCALPRRRRHLRPRVHHRHPVGWGAGWGAGWGVRGGVCTGLAAHKLGKACSHA